MQFTRAKNTKDVIAATQWILDNVGWIKGQYQKHNGKGKVVGFCLAGAIDAVEVDSMYVRSVAYNTITEALVEVAGDKPQYITGFNDHPKTRKRDIDRVLKRALKKVSK